MSEPVTTQVLVAGGGPAGLAAAVCAARAGAQVLLVERFGFLGGMATAGLVNPFMPYTLPDGTWLSDGLFREITDRLRAQGGLGSFSQQDDDCFDAEVFKFVADDLCQEAGVRLLLDATVSQPTVRDGLIQQVELVTKSGPLAAQAEVYVDCTGDADLAALAGVPCEVGRAEDALTQPMTLNFRMAGVDLERLPSRREINSLYDQERAAGSIDNPRENVLWFYHPAPGVVHFNTTRVVKRNPVDPFDLSAAELEARRQVRQMVAFLKSHVPGFERAYLQAMAPALGVRESRRIQGEYVLTERDILTARHFPDVVARGNYPVDIHNPAGAGTVIRHPPEGQAYHIPYRSLLPVAVDNLLVAGRSISATHEAQASLRIMPICVCLGQAAGVAAALAAAQHIPPRLLGYGALRRELDRQGANLAEGE